MLTQENKQFLESLSFAQLTTVLLDLYYKLPVFSYTYSGKAKEMNITADMVCAELNHRIYWQEV